MNSKLKPYHEKRNFEQTPEPKGKQGSRASGKPLRFCVQHHWASREHYDVRLEHNGVLLSWAVPKGPSFFSKDKRLAVHVEDHPIDYIDFEGTISKGEYGGGTVMLWDTGFYQALEDFNDGLNKGSLKFELFGKRLHGAWALVKLKNNSDGDDNWLLIKESDAYQQSKSGISQFTTSLKTGRTKEEIEQKQKVKNVKNPFRSVDLKLLKLSNHVPTGADWMYEIKYDGYRMVAFAENGTCKLYTRNQNDYTKHFSALANSLAQLATRRAFVIDGEVVITNESGLSDFSLLQQHVKSKNKYQPMFVAFDLLALDGIDLRDQSLITRRKKLEELLATAPKDIAFSKEIKGDGNQIFLQACNLNTEGIVAKKKSSVYSAVRNEDWQKIKCGNRQEFVIGGYTLSSAARGVRALLLGFYEEGKLIYCGKTGTGMRANDRIEMEQRLAKLAQKESAFASSPKPSAGETIVFVKPSMLAEVQFAGWTTSNALRHASFKGLRIDKDATHVTREQIKDQTIANKASKAKAEGLSVANKLIKSKEKLKTKKISEEKMQDQTKEKHQTKVTKTKTVKSTKGLKNTKNKTITIKDLSITNSDKALFRNPLVTKLDLITYYQKMAPRMMPYLQNRVVSIKRCPQGTNQTCFFERNLHYEHEGIQPVEIKSDKNEQSTYFSIDAISGLLYLAQLNTIEFHIWGSKASTIDFPDMMVFDLDPDEKMSLDQVRQGVKDLKNILDKLSLTSFLKTSGGKGYHVVLPFTSKQSWDKFFAFAKNVALLMEQTFPDKYTTNIRKQNRKNKIFIDFLRNKKSATSVAPYSVRAKQKATVSMPISWRELSTVAPDDITILEALERRKKADPWKAFFTIKQELV